MTNDRIAATLDRVANLLEEQAASRFRVQAWRDAARAVRDSPRELADVFRDHGRVGLEAIPHIGAGLSGVIIELVKTGRCGALERLQGDPVHRLTAVPGLGNVLAERIHRELDIDSLEDLEVAAYDGRLATVPGLGPRRIAALRGVLASMLSRRPSHAPTPARRPPVSLLLAIDHDYRAAAVAGTLRTIAPRRFNPEHTAWLPIMHTDRDGWSITAMFSNTELAHRLGRTHDWVVVYYHEPDGLEGQATIVTEVRGRMQGHRVVRGRERECEELLSASEIRSAS